MDEPSTAAAPKPCCVCDAPGGKQCTKCKSRHYCSKKCQLFDWKEGGHNKACKLLAANFQDRLLDELMPPKKVKEEPAIVEDVAPAAGLKAAARLSAVGATALVKPRALDDATQDWRGTCVICLELLPVDGVTFYDCCCKKICNECFDKCREYDNRCPLCRAPASTSAVETLRRLQKHVDKGDPEAQTMLGEAYRHGDLGLKANFKRAFQLFELAAAQGHADGQSKFGLRYQYGYGVKINLKTAVQWHRRAAEQGELDAQSSLGVMLLQGMGVAQSFDEAVKWFRLAAAEGDAGALTMLGLCYTNGHGVPQDLHEALRLFKRAAAMGQAVAAAEVKRLQPILDMIVKLDVKLQAYGVG